jgi:hypothetical protein
MEPINVNDQFNLNYIFLNLKPEKRFLWAIIPLDFCTVAPTEHTSPSSHEYSSTEYKKCNVLELPLLLQVFAMFFHLQAEIISMTWDRSHCLHWCLPNSLSVSTVSLMRQLAPCHTTGCIVVVYEFHLQIIYCAQYLPAKSTVLGRKSFYYNRHLIHFIGWPLASGNSFLKNWCGNNVTCSQLLAPLIFQEGFQNLTWQFLGLCSWSALWLYV